MTRQLSLFSTESVDLQVSKTEMRLLTWNVANPSLDRARKQFHWLANKKANAIILTETKLSAGCNYLKESFENIGYNVFFSHASDNRYSVMVAEKGFDGKKHFLGIEFLPERIQAIKLQTFMGSILLIGIYVPSRGPKERRNVDKRKFQDQLISLLNSFDGCDIKHHLLIGGDLNIIPPDHVPKYSLFGDWEYQFYNTFLDLGMRDCYKHFNPNGQEHSWIGRSGDGYRFDHLFLSKKIIKYATECFYIHTVRESRLSDHSALLLKITNPFAVS